MGSTGFDPIIGIVALVLLGLGAAAIVVARRRKGAAIVAALPLLLGVLMFGGLASTPSAQAACETPAPPAACVPNPDLASVVTEEYTWEFTRDIVDEEFYDFYSIELSEDDALALFDFPEPPIGTATLVFPAGEGAEVTITLTDEQWAIFENDSGGYYLYVLASVLEEGDEYLSRDFVYTVSTPGFCDSTFIALGNPPVG